MGKTPGDVYGLALSGLALSAEAFAEAAREDSDEMALPFLTVVTGEDNLVTFSRNGEIWERFGELLDGGLSDHLLLVE